MKFVFLIISNIILLQLVLYASKNDQCSIILSPNHMQKANIEDRNLMFSMWLKKAHIKYHNNLLFRFQNISKPNLTKRSTNYTMPPEHALWRELNEFKEHIINIIMRNTANSNTAKRNETSAIDLLAKVKGLLVQLDYHPEVHLGINVNALETKLNKELAYLYRESFLQQAVIQSSIDHIGIFLTKNRDFDVRTKYDFTLEYINYYYIILHQIRRLELLSKLEGSSTRSSVDLAQFKVFLEQFKSLENNYDVLPFEFR